MYVLDLFSGIGGFSLGLERAGMRTVGFCETDEYCRAVLRKHWPRVPCFDDIRAIDSDGLDRLGQIDVVTGGFPCQPFSVVGRQRAQTDDRYLWPEMRRVIALSRPAWVIGENVTGIIPLALDDVLADLETDGYAARAIVIPAAAVGAPHRRERVWIVANASRERRQQITGGASGDESSHERRAQKSNYEPTGPMQSSWPPGPGDVSRIPRAANGVSRGVDRHRCSCLGNAVVPQIVEEIGRAIMLSQ